MLNEPRLILHFETTNLTNRANLAWVDACGTGQNLQNEQNFTWVDTSLQTTTGAKLNLNKAEPERSGDSP